MKNMTILWKHSVFMLYAFKIAYEKIHITDEDMFWKEKFNIS